MKWIIILVFLIGCTHEHPFKFHYHNTYERQIQDLEKQVAELRQEIGAINNRCD